MKVGKLSPYNKNKIARMVNNDGFIFKQENTDYDARTEIQYLNPNDPSDGILAYISVGIDLDSNYTTYMGAGFPGGEFPPGFNGTLPPGFILPPGFTLPTSALPAATSTA